MEPLCKSGSLEQAYQTGGEMGGMEPISVLSTHKNLRNELNMTQRIHFINRNVQFDKFIKSVNSWLSIDIPV